MKASSFVLLALCSFVSCTNVGTRFAEPQTPTPLLPFGGRLFEIQNSEPCYPGPCPAQPGNPFNPYSVNPAYREEMKIFWQRYQQQQQQHGRDEHAHNHKHNRGSVPHQAQNPWGHANGGGVFPEVSPFKVPRGVGGPAWAGGNSGNARADPSLQFGPPKIWNAAFGGFQGGGEGIMNAPYLPQNYDNSPSPSESSQAENSSPSPKSSSPPPKVSPSSSHSTLTSNSESSEQTPTSSTQATTTASSKQVQSESAGSSSSPSSSESSNVVRSNFVVPELVSGSSTAVRSVGSPIHIPAPPSLPQPEDDIPKCECVSDDPDCECDSTTEREIAKIRKVTARTFKVKELIDKYTLWMDRARLGLMRMDRNIFKANATRHDLITEIGTLKLAKQMLEQEAAARVLKTDVQQAKVALARVTMKHEEIEREKEELSEASSNLKSTISTLQDQLSLATKIVQGIKELPPMREVKPR